MISIKGKKKRPALQHYHYDVFICHDPEDKAFPVEPLAHELRRNGLHVWYDAFTLTLGDSLSRSVELGLNQSRSGIVVLSPSFFAKEWPQKELDALVARQEGKVILPIWHRVSREDVAKFSPLLAGRYAVSTEHGLQQVLAQVLKAVNKRRSATSTTEGEIPRTSSPQEAKSEQELPPSKPEPIRVFLPTDRPRQKSPVTTEFLADKTTVQELISTGSWLC